MFLKNIFFREVPWFQTLMVFFYLKKNSKMINTLEKDLLEIQTLILQQPHQCTAFRKLLDSQIGISYHVYENRTTHIPNPLKISHTVSAFMLVEKDRSAQSGRHCHLAVRAEKNKPAKGLCLIILNSWRNILQVARVEQLQQNLVGRDLW